MSDGPAHNPVVEAASLPWEAQDALARRATLTRLLIRISREALQGVSLTPMLRGICDCLIAELPVTIASVILLDEANRYFVHEVYAGTFTQSPLAAQGEWSVASGLAGRCAREGKAQLILDVDADPDYVAGNHLTRAEYLIPLRHRERLHGVLNIESSRPDLLDAEACAVFDAVADLVASAIHFARLADELQQANIKLEEMTMSDGLTGIANRRCFDQRLREEWARMQADDRPLGLVLVDADAFKPLNDACGHLHGDECLRELARICQRVVPSHRDLVARFGGEELVLLLPGRELAEAEAIGERLRASVQAADIAHPASPVAACVTVSVGVASLRPTATLSPDLLVAAADGALYAAKRQGRNRVCSQRAALTRQGA